MKGLSVLILLLGLVVAVCLPDTVLQRLLSPVGRIVQTARPISQSASTSARDPGRRDALPEHVPSGRPTHSAVSSTPVAVEPITHIVGPGDTLGALAAAYGVTVGDLAEANDIVDPNLIRVGQALVIPEPK